MEASGQTQVPATLPLGKEPSLHTEQVAGLASADLYVLEKRKISFLCHVSRPITFQPVATAFTQTTPADVFFLLRKMKTTLKRGRRQVLKNF